MLFNPNNHINISDLSPRHQAAVRRFVDKYKAGAKEHGDLQVGKKWTKDMLMELVDANFYAIFELLEIEEGEEEVDSGGD